MGHYFTNEVLESNLKKIFVKVRDKNFVFYTDNGVFSKRGLDFGSRTLIETLIDCDIRGKILDVGSGYGACGIILSSFFDNVDVDMVDVNRRAVNLSKINIRENKCSNVTAFVSNIYDNVNFKYDVIVTNPPIRAGKEILYKFLFEAKKHLVSGGMLYFVINKDQGAKSVIRDLSEIASVDVLKKNKGFFIIRCVFN